MSRIDDFSKPIKLKLAKRVSFKCSNPGCRRATSGPTLQKSDGTVNIGVAAHITAASPDGARYDATMPSGLRKSIDNAIWCCQTCGKLIDDDESKFTVAMLQKWKAAAEQEAARDLEVRNNFDSFVAVDDEERDAKQDILLGALEGHEGNMIVFSERNGWDVVSIIGEHYCTNQEERTLYVEAMLQLIEEASVRRRGAGIAYELTRQGLKQAKKLREMGVVRRKPGMQ